MRCIIEKGLNAAEVWHVFETTKLCKCHNNYSSLNNQSYDIIPLDLGDSCFFINSEQKSFDYYTCEN